MVGRQGGGVLEAGRRLGVERASLWLLVWVLQWMCGWVMQAVGWLVGGVVRRFGRGCVGEGMQSAHDMGLCARSSLPAGCSCKGAR